VQLVKLVVADDLARRDVDCRGGEHAVQPSRRRDCHAEDGAH
jgi:hypothetical protein